MVDFAEENPFLARLRKTRHRLDHYARAHDAVSLSRAYELACTREENLAELAARRATVPPLRARYLELRAALRAKTGLELPAAQLARMHRLWWAFFDAVRFLGPETPPPYRLEVGGRVHELDLAGEARLKLCVSAYGEWRRAVRAWRSRARFLRAQAKGGSERGYFARVRWRRVQMKWRAVCAWKKGLVRKDGGVEGSTQEPAE